jgi:hypothetical protein
VYVLVALTDDGKFLLAACKLKHTTCTDYIISLRSDDMSRRSQAYVGKVRCVYMIKQATQKGYRSLVLIKSLIISILSLALMD